MFHNYGFIITGLLVAVDILDGFCRAILLVLMEEAKAGLIAAIIALVALSALLSCPKALKSIPNVPSFPPDDIEQ